MNREIFGDKCFIQRDVYKPSLDIQRYMKLPVGGMRNGY